MEIFPFTQFWDSFFIIAKQHTDLYLETKNSHRHYIKTNTGIGGVGFSTCLNTKSGKSWVELCIQKNEAKENSALFNEYFDKKNEIENKFGAPLRWIDEKGTKRCKIMSEEISFDTENTGGWNKLHKKLAKKMVKLTNALKGCGIY